MKELKILKNNGTKLIYFFIITIGISLTCFGGIKLRNFNKQKIVSLVSNNESKKQLKKEYLQKISFDKSLEKLNNSKKIEISSNDIIVNKELNISSLNEVEKNIIKIIYLNRKLNINLLKKIYLENYFESDYQELLKDNILKEEYNGIIYKKNIVSANELFFLIMSSIFWGSIFIRLIKDKKKINNLKNFRDTLENTEDYGELNEKIEGLPNNSIIKKEWKNYIETLYTKDGKKYETIDSDNFFNFDVIYKQQISYKVFNYMPQFLVGLGMLGTFYGLTSGLSQLDLSNVESIEVGVGSLLSGVKTAFYTSLFGLSYSLVLSNFINIHFNDIEKTITIIRRKINSLTKKSIKEDSIDIIIKSLNDIKESNNDMAKELSGQINIMSENLNKNISDYSSNVGTKIANQIETMAKEISTNISDFSNSVGTNFKTELSQSLEKIFNEELIANINDSLGQISVIFSDNSLKMKEFKEEITISIEKLSELKISYLDILKETSELKENFAETIEKINSDFKKVIIEVDKVSTKYVETSNQLTEMLDELVSVQNNNVKILEENKNVMNVATTLLENSKELFYAEKEVQELWSNYEETFKGINEKLSTNLEQYQEKLSESLEKYKENLKETSIELRSILKQSSDEYNIFIKNQTVDYTKEIKNGLVDLFTDYDKNLSIAIGSFNSALQTFDEKIIKFSEVIIETKEMTENQVDILKIENKLIEEKIETFDKKLEALKENTISKEREEK